MKNIIYINKNSNKKINIKKYWKKLNCNYNFFFIILVDISICNSVV